MRGTKLLAIAKHAKNHTDCHQFLCEECSKEEKHSTHIKKNLEEISKSNFVLLAMTDQILENIEKHLEMQIADANMSVSSFDMHNPQLKSAIERVEAAFEEKKQKALASLERFANGEKMKMVDKRIGIQQKLRELKKAKKNVQRKMKRKIDLHDISEIEKSTAGFCKSGVPPIKNFPQFKNYSFTPDMSSYPTPPFNIDALQRN
uniref:B box-type domain-containing protein n=1 Tax=Caenorhabditis tropicalis TaxID=1561998 RepID=A0A1I7T4C6_9PELO